MRFMRVALYPGLAALLLAACGGPELIVNTRNAPAKVYFRALEDAAGNQFPRGAPETLIGETAREDEEDPHLLEWEVPEELLGARVSLTLEFDTGVKDLQISLQKARDTRVLEGAPPRAK
jgi:hypothetical protein